jgi:hypothetical protein
MADLMRFSGRRRVAFWRIEPDAAIGRRAFSARGLPEEFTMLSKSDEEK